VVLYADDTNLLIMGKDKADLQCKLTKTIEELETWFQSNNLIINTKKDICNVLPPKAVDRTFKCCVTKFKVDVVYCCIVLFPTFQGSSWLVRQQEASFEKELKMGDSASGKKHQGAEKTSRPLMNLQSNQNKIPV
jgi:hypothetical protein